GFERRAAVRCWSMVQVQKPRLSRRSRVEHPKQPDVTPLKLLFLSQIQPIVERNFPTSSFPRVAIPLGLYRFSPTNPIRSEAAARFPPPPPSVERLAAQQHLVLSGRAGSRFHQNRHSTSVQKDVATISRRPRFQSIRSMVRCHREIVARFQAPFPTQRPPS